MKKLRLDTKIDLPTVKALFMRWSVAWEVEPLFRVNADADLVALAIIAIVFVVQVAVAWDRSLTPDEALIFGLINFRSPIEAFRSALADPHPPLFFMLLHLWTRLGHSEIFLRLLPMAFGGGFLWFLYRWASAVLGSMAGVLTVLVVSLSSAWLPLSAEVRDYSLTLMLSAAALLEFELSVETRSTGKALLSWFFLYLAVLSHYSAFLIAASFAVYELVRLRQARAPRRLLRVWVSCCGGVAVLFVMLYFVQIRGVIGSGRAAVAKDDWLSAGYFRSYRESAVSFVLQRTWAIFRYFFGSPGMAAVALLLTVVGVASLGLKKRPVVVLVTLPWVLGATAGLVRLYPYIGWRHSIYLLLCVSVAIGAALAALAAERRWLALVASAAVAFASWTPPAWATAPGSTSQLNAAMHELRRRAPAGSLLYVDYHTRLLLSYYLGRGRTNSDAPSFLYQRETSIGPYRVVGPPIWNVDARGFCNEVDGILHSEGSAEPHPWVLRYAPAYDPVAALARRLPDAHFPTVLRSGDLWIVEACLDASSQSSTGAR